MIGFLKIGQAKQIIGGGMIQFGQHHKKAGENFLFANLIIAINPLVNSQKDGYFFLHQIMILTQIL